MKAAFFPEFFDGCGNSRPRLATSSWENSAVEQPFAAVVILHGLAEHAGRYTHFAAHLNKNNMFAFSYDHRGHGRSEGARLFAEAADEFVNDVETFVELVAQWIPGIPIFMYCHSMGGLIGALYGIQNKVSSRVKGFVFSSPAFAPGEFVGGSSMIAFTRAVSSFASVLAPKFRIRAYDAREVSTLESEQKKYTDDKLNCQAGVTAGLGNLLFKSMDHIKSNQAFFCFPALVFVGRKDYLVSQQAIADFFHAIQHADKSFFIAENSKHEVLNDVDSGEVMLWVVDWIKERSINLE
jgi:acylglycerol lipase